MTLNLTSTPIVVEVGGERVLDTTYVCSCTANCSMCLSSIGDGGQVYCEGCASHECCLSEGEADKIVAGRIRHWAGQLELTKIERELLDRFADIVQNDRPVSKL